MTGQVRDCFILSISPTTALSWKGPQWHSLREKFAPTSRRWLCLFGHVWVRDPITVRRTPGVLVCPRRSEAHAEHPYGTVLLPSVTQACHCSVALISLRQSRLPLLPAVTDWPDCVTQSQILSSSLLRKQTHLEMTLNLVVLSALTTIWVHMAPLVCSAICYQCRQAVVLIWIILVSRALCCWIPSLCFKGAFMPLT